MIVRISDCTCGSDCLHTSSRVVASAALGLGSLRDREFNPEIKLMRKQEDNLMIVSSVASNVLGTIDFRSTARRFRQRCVRRRCLHHLQLSPAPLHRRLRPRRGHGVSPDGQEMKNCKPE